MRLSGRITRRAFLVSLGGLAAAVTSWGIARRKGERVPDGEIALGRADVGAEGPFDVCIIGSGFAGVVLGRDLVRSGLRTVILESGSARGGPIEPRLSRLEVYESTGNASYPLILTRARAVGGTSHLWTGRCDRLHPLDFEPNAYTPSGAAWPIRYAELEPYYERAERTLRVRGGRLSEFSPPRQRSFPISTPWWRTFGLNSMLAKIDVALDESPTSRGARGDATMRVDRDLLPELIRSSHAALAPLSTATRLVADETGRVTGVEAMRLDGSTGLVRAHTYILACGAVETARLLLLSRSPHFPDGVGNRSGLVGRGFTEHPNLTFHGRVPGMRALLPLEISRSHQFYEAFKREGFGSVLLVFERGRSSGNRLRIGATVEMRPSPENRVTLSEARRDAFRNPGASLHLDLSVDDNRTLDRARELIRSIYGKLGVRDFRERPLSWSHHHIGTCRMGDDPRTSVTDRNLRVHDSPNLYVVGSGVFVTGGASHPTLLITALAHRLAEHLRSELRA